MHFLYTITSRGMPRFMVYGGISLGFMILVTYLFHGWVDRPFIRFLEEYQPALVYSFFEKFTLWMDYVFLGKHLYLLNYRQENSILTLFLFRYLPLLSLWALTRWVFRYKKFALVFLWAVACHLLSTAEVVGIKYLFSRSRPFVWLDQGIYLFHFPGGQGDAFPSGHTADYLALFLPFAWYHRQYAGFILLIPLLIAFGRLALWMHYPSDVLAAIYVVVLAAILTKLVFFKELTPSVK